MAWIVKVGVAKYLTQSEMETMLMNSMVISTVKVLPLRAYPVC